MLHLPNVFGSGDISMYIAALLNARFVHTFLHICQARWLFTGRALFVYDANWRINATSDTAELRHKIQHIGAHTRMHNRVTEMGATP